MAADMHIHVRTKEVTDAVYIAFNWNTLGAGVSPYDKACKAHDAGDQETVERIMAEYDAGNMYELLILPPPSGPTWDEAYEIISSTPSVWVGEVSWLKAALTGESKFIPDPVGVISELIPDMEKVTDELIAKVEEAMHLDNTTPYDVSTPNKIVEFLKEHKGETVFTVNW